MPRDEFLPDPDDEDEDPEESPQPVQGHVRHSNLSARVPEQVGSGVFSNGVLILSGQFECVLDFVLRMGEVQRIVARVVVPPMVARQFERALRENVRNYENRFGGTPRPPRMLPPDSEYEVPQEPGLSVGSNEGGGEAGGAARPPEIDDIYHELRLADEMLSGRYANAVLIRHSGTEFCFDFLTNIYPRSAVSCRVFMSAPNVPAFLESLARSLQPPPDSPELA